MSSWPTALVDTSNTDAGTDNPASARADLLATMRALNDIIDAGVSKDGIQTITGAKMFTVAPAVPEGVLPDNPVSRRQAVGFGALSLQRRDTPQVSGGLVLFDYALGNDRLFWNASTGAIVLPSGFHHIAVNVAIGNGGAANTPMTLKLTIAGVVRSVWTGVVPAGGFVVAPLTFCGLAGGNLTISSSTAFNSLLYVNNLFSGGDYSACSNLGVITLPV